MESWVECMDQNGHGPSKMGSSTNIQRNKCLKVFDKIHLTFVFFNVWALISPHKSWFSHVCEHFLLIQWRTLNVCTNIKLCVKINHKDIPCIWKALNVWVWDEQLTIKFKFSKTLNSILVPSIFCIILQCLLESDWIQWDELISSSVLLNQNRGFNAKINI